MQVLSDPRHLSSYQGKPKTFFFFSRRKVWVYILNDLEKRSDGRKKIKKPFMSIEDIFL